MRPRPRRRPCWRRRPRCAAAGARPCTVCRALALRRPARWDASAAHGTALVHLFCCISAYAGCLLPLVAPPCAGVLVPVCVGMAALAPSSRAHRVARLPRLCTTPTTAAGPARRCRHACRAWLSHLLRGLGPSESTAATARSPASRRTQWVLARGPMGRTRRGWRAPGGQVGQAAAQPPRHLRDARAARARCRGRRLRARLEAAGGRLGRRRTPRHIALPSAGPVSRHCGGQCSP